MDVLHPTTQSRCILARSDSLNSQDSCLGIIANQVGSGSTGSAPSRILLRYLQNFNHLLWSVFDETIVRCQPATGDLSMKRITVHLATLTFMSISLLGVTTIGSISADEYNVEGRYKRIKPARPLEQRYDQAEQA